MIRFIPQLAPIGEIHLVKMFVDVNIIYEEVCRIVFLTTFQNCRVRCPPIILMHIPSANYFNCSIEKGVPNLTINELILLCTTCICFFARKMD